MIFSNPGSELDNFSPWVHAILRALTLSGTGPSSEGPFLHLEAILKPFLSFNQTLFQPNL